MIKFVFVTGDVVSSLGKGIAAASLAAILESRGLKVTLIKLDPYINVDPGTMSFFQHGEVFVTKSIRLHHWARKCCRLSMKLPDSEWKICESYSNGTLCYMHTMRKQVIYLRQVLLLMHSSR